MGSPTLTKTWQFSTNVSKTTTANATTDHQQVLLSIVNTLIGWAHAPWAVRSSSNSSTASTSNNWSTNSNLVWNNAGSAHSWIVLRQTGVGSTFDICIDLNTTTLSTLTVCFSPGGYNTTGLSTTARPTTVNSDEVNVAIGTGQWTATSGTFSAFISCMQSQDGQCTRFFVYSSTSLYTCFYIEKLQNAPSSWAYPYAVGFMTSQDGMTYGSDLTTYGDANDNSASSTPFTACRVSSSSVGAVYYTRPAFTVEYCNNDYVSHQQTVANSLDGSFCMAPIQLHGPSVLPIGYGHGCLGNLADMWMGQSTGVTNGDTYASKTFIQINNVILPWDGSTPSGPSSPTDRTAGYLASVGDQSPLGGVPLSAPTPAPPTNRAI